MAGKVCPVWVGYLLASPVRRLYQNPENILSPYVDESMKVLDIGCAMGFFSLPLARMVGASGKVVCVDLQEKMIQSLEKRARKAGLIERIETRLCPRNSLGLEDINEEIDFAFASAVVHEIPDAPHFFSEIYQTLKPTGRFLVLEPKGHVSEKDFQVTVSVSENSGFTVVDRPQIGRGRVVLLQRKE